MNADDCRRRVAEIKKRRAQGVAVFPDDLDFLEIMAGYGCCWLMHEEDEQAEKDAAFKRIWVR
jgi:hypothetical protein